eukprot:3862705-Pleurochrysis_carterae.AAC.1
MCATQRAAASKPFCVCAPCHLATYGCAVCNSQEGKSPLHVAAAMNTSSKLVAALLEACPDAIKTKDNVSCPASGSTC